MKYSRCQHENFAGMKFCGQCAGPLAVHARNTMVSWLPGGINRVHTGVRTTGQPS
jgi:hypothetical protein